MITHYCKPDQPFDFEFLDNGKCPNCGEYYPDDDYEDYLEEDSEEIILINNRYKIK